MHFIARNQRYPQYSFCVRSLRPLLDKKGRIQDSVIVRFDNGFLDTKAQGYTQEEAKRIREQLEKLTDTHVVLDYVPILAETDEGVAVKAISSSLSVAIKE